MPLTPRAREKTAFPTPEGLFQYCVLPFGVHEAPATFQRLMYQVLRPHHEYAAAYIDDLIVHSADWQTHLDQLEEVHGALWKAGLTANLQNAGLFQIAQARNEKAGENLPGIGRVSPSIYSPICHHSCPLHKDTGKNQTNKVQWTEEMEQAFSALCTSPVLATPDFSKQFVVQTDASEVGKGTVLSQIQDCTDHPILFISRKLLKHERNYATIDKEALAIKWALGKLQYYLLGREFLLVTDHAPLKLMASNKSQNACVTS